MNGVGPSRTSTSLTICPGSTATGSTHKSTTTGAINRARMPVFLPEQQEESQANSALVRVERLKTW
jgi:hypothetical protein